MAGVKPVEYKKDSSTVGFAVAGDQKQITSGNAVTIEKDVKQGNTKDLDNAQSRYLESQIEDEDNIEYSDDERRNVGKNQIDTDDSKNKDNSTAATAATGAAVGAAVAAGVVVQSTTVVTTTTVAMPAIGNIPAHTVQIQTNTVKAADGFTQLIMSGTLLASAVASAVLAFLMDPTLGEKENQVNAADDTNATIQSYYDQMTADMDTMTEDAAKYQELSDQKVTSDVDRITQIGALQAQLAVYQSQNNAEKISEIQAQIDELTKEGEADGTGAEIDELQKSLETYSGNNAEAIGVADSGATVSDFLKEGHKIKTLATIDATLLSLCGVYCLGAVLAMFPKIAPFFPDLGGNLAAKVMMGAAGAAFAVAAYKMRATAKSEGEAADAGDTMAKYVSNLRSNVEAQGGFTETTGAEYTEIATKNAETTQKTQEGVDKANKNNPPLTTPNGKGNGNGENPDEDKLPVVGAGEGAAA